MARFLEWGDANTKGTMILSVFTRVYGPSADKKRRVFRKSWGA